MFQEANYMLINCLNCFCNIKLPIIIQIIFSVLKCKAAYNLPHVYQISAIHSFAK